MRHFSILLLLLSSIASAQINFKSLQSFKNDPLEFRYDHFSSRDLVPFQIQLPDQSLMVRDISPADFKIITPQQYNLTNYPMRDLSKMDDLLMGTSISNTIELGRQKIETTYIFDLSGNLRGTQTSFPIGKKN